jgi:DNA-binding MarR family transcriptional regulator
MGKLRAGLAGRPQISFRMRTVKRCYRVYMTPSPDHASAGTAFLLTQIGRHAADRFAERIAELDLTPPLTGILRVIAMEPGRSQQALSEQLSLMPSRVVAFLDDLEDRGLVQRRRNPDDRRLYALYLTAAGETMMREIGRIAREHEQDITSGLDRQQRATLAQLLTEIAERQGLRPGVHPGYRAIGK